MSKSGVHKNTKNIIKLTIIVNTLYKTSFVTIHEQFNRTAIEFDPDKNASSSEITDSPIGAQELLFWFWWVVSVTEIWIDFDVFCDFSENTQV